MRGLSHWLQEQIVAPLNELGVPIDLREVQVVLVLSPIVIVFLAFGQAWWRRRRKLKDAGMQ